jgi:AcrR family transcriptional regulator
MSSRVTRRQSQAQTRRRLIDAAASAFREHGFHRASADALATSAGFTRGALYANFDGKDGLFLAVLDEEIEARTKAFTPTEDVRGAASVYRTLLDDDRGWTLALLEFTTHAARHPELAEQLRARNRALRAVIVGLIREAQPDLSPHSAEVGAKLVMAVNTGVALERALDRDAAGEAELARAYLAATTEGA